MEETKFLKVYRFILLPLYLLLCVFWFMAYLDFASMNDPSKSVYANIILILLGIAHLLYIALTGYILIRFGKKTKMLYVLNMILLYALPFLFELSMITYEIAYEPYFFIDFLSYAWINAVLYYLFLYIILFIIFFLPQVIYFENRKWLFTQRTEQ